MLESRITRIEMAIARDAPRGFTPEEIAQRNEFTFVEVRDVMHRLDLINADVNVPPLVSGKCANGHDKATDTYVSPSGKRKCRGCQRESSRRQSRNRRKPKAHLTLVEATAAAQLHILDSAEEAMKRHPAGGSDAQ